MPQPGITGSHMAALEQRRERLLDAAQFRSRPWDFDRAKWITEVERAAARVDGCSSVVAPFGFEPIFAPSTLTIRPRRYYVYLTAAGDNARVERRLADEIVACVLPDTRIVVTSSESTVRAVGRRGSLYVRTIGAGPRGATALYARYLAALPLLAVEGRLRERRDFDTRPSARRFLMHTTIALALVHPEVEPPRDADVRKMADLARAQEDRDAATGGPPERAADPDERAVLDEAILPYLRKISTWLSEGRPGTTTVVDVHSGETSSVHADEERLASVAARIEAFYRPAPRPS